MRWWSDNYQRGDNNRYLVIDYEIKDNSMPTDEEIIKAIRKDTVLGLGDVYEDEDLSEIITERDKIILDNFKRIYKLINDDIDTRFKRCK